MSFKVEFEEIYNDGENKITADLETGECYCETFIKEDNEWIDISCDNFHTYTKKYVDNILTEYLKNKRRQKQVKSTEKKKELEKTENKKEKKCIIDEDDFVWIEEYKSLRDLYDDLKPEKILIYVEQYDNTEYLSIDMKPLNKERKMYEYKNTIHPKFYTYTITEKDKKLIKEGKKSEDEVGTKKYEKEARGLHTLYRQLKEDGFMEDIITIDKKTNTEIHDYRFKPKMKKILLSNFELKPYVCIIPGEKYPKFVESYKQIISFNNKYYENKININDKDIDEKIDKIIKKWIEDDGNISIVDEKGVKKTLQIRFYLNYTIKYIK